MAEVRLPIKPFTPHWPKVVLAAIILFVLLALGVLILVYKLPESALGRLFTNRFPFPIIFIGQGVAVTTTGLAENRTAIRHFYESQDFSQIGMRVDFTTPDGQKRLKLREKDLLNKMLEDKVIELLARDRGIAVTSQQVVEATTNKMKELGTVDKVEAMLARLYNWSIADFQEKIVRPALYEEALYSAYEKEVDHTQAEERIAEAEKALKSKKTFDEVVRSYSEGETRADGGELGWFRLEDLSPELRGPVDNAKIKVPTGTIESPLGYHIVLVEETKLENEQRLFHIRQIFTRKVSFTDWIAEQMKGLPIRIFSEEYEWQREAARVEFRSAEMKDFEKKFRENAENDPSLLF